MMFQRESIWGESMGEWSTLKAAFYDGYFPQYSSLRSIYVAIDRGIFPGMTTRVNPLTGRPGREIWVHLPRLAELTSARGYPPPTPRR